MSRRVVVMGASAGGVEALRSVMAGLPPGLAAGVIVVLHIPRGAPSALPGILDRAGPLEAVPAAQDAPLHDGVVHVAPADHHVLLVDGHLQLSKGPTENGHRPALDPLFRSAALSHGPGAVGVVLSGTRDDGSAGLAAIAAAGGAAVVQDPEDALYAAMPANALTQVPAALVHPAAKIGAVLGELVDASVPTRVGIPDGALLRAETRIAAAGLPTTETLEAAAPSPYSCPSCSGVLFELPGAPAPRFRCRIGHAWSPSSLEAEQTQSVDDALWTALRALEEKGALLTRLATEARERGHTRTAALHAQRATHAKAQAAQVRGLVGGGDTNGDRGGGPR
jgi:two-component system, chemotaxis family, protein-glutamate methylesterase/glutaminase